MIPLDRLYVDGSEISLKCLNKDNIHPDRKSLQACFWSSFSDQAFAISMSYIGSKAASQEFSSPEAAFGRVEMWRGGFRFGVVCNRPFRLAVP